jgi:hypothetical protein
MTMTKTWGIDGDGGGSAVGVGLGCCCMAATGVWLGWTTTAADFMEQALPASRATRATAVHLDKGIGVE